MFRKLSRKYFARLLACGVTGLFLIGCAGPPVRTLPPSSSPIPPTPPPAASPRLPEAPPSAAFPPASSIPPEPPSLVRTFPQFAAVIAQTGDTFSSLAEKYLQDSSLEWVIREFNRTELLRPGQEVIIPLRFRERGGVSLSGYQTVPVIVYHKFAKKSTDLMTLSEGAFEEQMRFLKENGYRVVSMDAFFDFLDYRIPLPPKSIVITADDGWRSFYDIAFPILKRYGYPATLFVYTDFISGRRGTLDWGILAEMSRGGIDIQSHTKTHRYLDRRNASESFPEYFEALRREITEAADQIQRKLNKKVTYLAYPYGETNSLTIAFLQKLGYRGAFTVDRGSNPFFSHPYRIRRSMIYGNFDLQDFERNLAVFTAHDPAKKSPGSAAARE